MEEIRGWWEVPCIAHFCHIFAKPFKLVDFEIEELEDTLLLDEIKEDPTPSLLVNLFCGLLNGIVDKEVTEENWEFFLKMHLQWRTDHLDEEWNPHRDKIYKDLDTRTKVEILHKMIHWRMELDDIGDLLRGIDGPTLRIHPLGKDESGNVYWYFYGTRLYMETAKKKPPRKTKQDQATPNKGKKGKGASKGKGSSPVPEEFTEEGGVWKMACSTLEEWEELVEDLSNIKRGDGRKLYNYLNNELLPHVLYNLQQKEKMFKKKMLAELPRRTSNRLAQKAEEEILCALAREQQREEFRKKEAEEKAMKEAEAEKRHNEKIEEVMRHRKAKEEEQAKQRQEEEKNWSLAMSGELSGPRQAAIGAVQGVVDTQTLIEDTFKDEVLHTAMFKVLCGLRRHEDGWVFEEPVSEDIAPGYFDVVSKPMDFQTVEKKIESNEYTTKDEFVSDVLLIFENCKAYNGEESEYYALSNEMKELFEKFLSEEFVEDMLDKVEEEEESGGKRGRKKNSPSPELTSESSEESEEEEEDEEDEDEIDNVKKIKKKSMKLHKMDSNVPPPQMMVRPPGGMPMHRMYGPHMMQPGMRPLPPEMMMGYPPQYPPFGPYPPHPHMQMRPPRDMYYAPPDGGYPRYTYPMNGAPPPYRPHIFPPDFPPMNPSMGAPSRHMPPHGGPPPSSQLHVPNGPVNAESQSKGDKVKRVSSPRVSSTVQTPPTSGDEHGDEENRISQEESKMEEQEENKKQSSDSKESSKPEQHATTPPQPNANYPPAYNHSSHTPPGYPPGWPPRPGMMRGEYPPPPHMMNERYRQAMMAAAHQRQMNNYPPMPPPDNPAMWNGQQQRPPYPPYGPHHQQMIMMERQRRAYYEYQMKMRMRGPPQPRKDQQNPTTDSQPPSTNHEKPSLPDYHDSLTHYAIKLTKEDQTEVPKNDDQKTKENDAPVTEENNQSDEQGKSEKPKDDSNTNNESKDTVDQSTKQDKPVQQQANTPPPSWPRPSHYHQMMSNGYGMPPHMAPPHHSYSPNMYSRPPHPSQMHYPHYPDPSLYGSGGYNPADVERWHYMEMQRQQWMIQQQQRHYQLTKRPRSHDDEKLSLSHKNQKLESHDSHMTTPNEELSTEEEPPSKQPRNDSTETEKVNGLTEETTS